MPEARSSASAPTGLRVEADHTPAEAAASQPPVLALLSGPAPIYLLVFPSCLLRILAVRIRCPMGVCLQAEHPLHPGLCKGVRWDTKL
ncbi:hypothetical protein NDU88_001278 [Pleurodeles waltl]|uniref:Uncharacterized protein n=1 Tax=Pleurodeles waltl TaxID=8319 RepID=A0AAV7NAF3_PLEWA|nr:hypothetical protein NDU88_001278 [Pleurodeles waltl]